MSSYLREARECAQKIRRHHDYGDTRSYTAALRSYNRLSELLYMAGNSKVGKKDVSEIHHLYLSMKQLMDEMLERDMDFQNKNV